MPFSTLEELVTATEVAIYQSAGPQVQIYSQDILSQMILRGFTLAFDKRYWHYFRKREQRTLDGTTGQITSVLTHITEYKDIQGVFIEGSQRRLPILPASYNTLGMTGSRGRFIEASDNTKLFVVYPLTSEGDVLVVGRRRPSISAMDDEVPFDATYLVNYAAFEYFTDDASNPGAAQKHQGLYETRLKQLEEMDEQHAVQLDALSSEIPTDWYYA